MCVCLLRIGRVVVVSDSRVSARNFYYYYFFRVRKPNRMITHTHTHTRWVFSVCKVRTTAALSFGLVDDDVFIERRLRRRREEGPGARPRRVPRCVSARATQFVAPPSLLRACMYIYMYKERKTPEYGQKYGRELIKTLALARKYSECVCAYTECVRVRVLGLDLERLLSVHVFIYTRSASARRSLSFCP